MMLILMYIICCGFLRPDFSFLGVDFLKYQFFVGPLKDQVFGLMWIDVRVFGW